MYIAKISVENYRCLNKIEVDFVPGLNVIIGENNSGKSALIRAIGLFFDSKLRTNFCKHDFYQGIKDFTKPPTINISLVIRSSGKDTIDDRALVATWLTKFESPWEAQLTFKFFLPEKDEKDFIANLGQPPKEIDFWQTVEEYLPKYISRIYAGNPDAQIKAEPEWLNKFDYHFLDSIRDVEAELFSGANPLLKNMLLSTLDQDLAGIEDENLKKRARRLEFLTNSNRLKETLQNRLKLDSLFDLIKHTGAAVGGTPKIGGKIEEEDIIAALKMFVESDLKYELPINFNGLGYNNLIYISLVLAYLNLKTDAKLQGENTIVFPILSIEEPEAHLHPSLQYKLLKYIKSRIEKQKSRQVFITTHSTQITAASGLDPLICTYNTTDGIAVAYPGKVFSADQQGVESKKYVERFLDATKSNMLFSKGVIFVEGIAELLLIPIFADYTGNPLEDKHVTVIASGGLTFKHFLPLFGAVTKADFQKYSLNKRKVACIIDRDPAHKEKKQGSKWKNCWPFLLDIDTSKYEYKPLSGVITNLQTLKKNANNIELFFGNEYYKTLEYDVAYSNPSSPLLMTMLGETQTNFENFLKDPIKYPTFANDLSEEEQKAITVIADAEIKRKSFFAAYYLIAVQDEKGEYAYDLAMSLRENLAKSKPQEFNVPKYIKDAINWICT
jgi:putative ATP-dependent endonuclease of OLD family